MSRKWIGSWDKKQMSSKSQSEPQNYSYYGELFDLPLTFPGFGQLALGTMMEWLLFKWLLARPPPRWWWWWWWPRWRDSAATTRAPKIFFISLSGFRFLYSIANNWRKLQVGFEPLRAVTLLSTSTVALPGSPSNRLTSLTLRSISSSSWNENRNISWNYIVQKVTRVCLKVMFVSQNKVHLKRLHTQNFSFSHLLVVLAALVNLTHSLISLLPHFLLSLFLGVLAMQVCSWWLSAQVIIFLDFRLWTRSIVQLR